MEVLVRGKSMLLSPEDFELIQDKAVCLKSKGYAHVYLGNGKYETVHRLVAEAMGLDKSLMVDHINGNVLDNRRCNLRSATRAQNMQNSQIRKDNRTGYKGVAYFARSGKYRARIRHNNVRIFLGCFDTPQDAARAYNEAALKYHGEFARLNIIEA